MRGMIAKVAPTDATVLINGENGTGKELVANELFKASGRARGAVHQGELRGGQRDADRERVFRTRERLVHRRATIGGKAASSWRTAGRSCSTKSAKSRRRCRRSCCACCRSGNSSGSAATRRSRWTCACWRRRTATCNESVENGEFREDLYYRLNVFPLTVPPLRERAGDVLLLARQFLERSSRRYGAKMQGFSDAASDAMSRYPWPGNVRELQNVIERAVILAEGPWVELETLGLPDVGLSARAPVPVREASSAEAAAPTVGCRTRDGGNAAFARRGREAAYLARAGVHRRQPDAGGEPIEDQYSHLAQQAAPVPHRSRRRSGTRQWGGGVICRGYCGFSEFDCRRSLLSS